MTASTTIVVRLSPKKCVVPGQPPYERRVVDGEPEGDRTTHAEAEQVDLREARVLEQADHVRRRSLGGQRSVDVVRPSVALEVGGARTRLTRGVERGPGAADAVAVLGPVPLRR